MRLIDAGKLQDNLRDIYGGNGENTVVWYGDILALVDEQPVVTPESLVRRGRWEYDGMTGTMDNPLMRNYCSVCEMVVIDAEEQKFRFCPYCGAKMAED